ncbi:MAG: hypothetical protein K9L24_03655, partial [Spirochaetia bacterium]|nr:hypothetical protein [Spirochaetia bacterium]
MSKYLKGDLITTMRELAECLDAGELLYIRHKVYHPGFILSMQYRYLSNMVKHGNVWKAAQIENPIIYQKIKQVFLSQNGNKGITSNKEGLAINQLIKKAQVYSPDDFERVIKAIIVKFWELKISREGFWTRQPFLPSALNADGIWERV